MTEKELECAIKAHEMQRLELKESFGAETIESACAFANADGGYIVIGVDNRGNPSRLQLREEALRDYENRISTATEPSVAVEAEKVMFREREVVVLRVRENPLKPVAVKGRCFVRRGSVNHQMTPVEIAESHLKSCGGSMDAVLVQEATKDELDMETVRLYMQKAVAENRRDFPADEDPWHTLLKLGLVKSETEITRAAYLLFARNPQERFSQAVIHSGAFKAGGAVIIDSHDSHGNIQDQIEDALAFIQRNIRCAIVISGKAEHDRYWEYPLEALREALANAVCHRDYGLANDIQIKILEDRILITNPGQLPFDMSLEDLEDPDHSSRPRNKLIAQVFYDMHIIEHYGSGVRRIKDDCDKNGNPYPVWKSARGEFQVKFPSRTLESVAKLGIDPEKLGVSSIVPAAKNQENKAEPFGETVVKDLGTVVKDPGTVVKDPGTGVKDPETVVKQQNIGEDGATAGEKIIRLIIENPKITRHELAMATALSVRGVEYNLKVLKAANRIRRVGPDKGGHWEVCECR